MQIYTIKGRFKATKQLDSLTSLSVRLRHKTVMNSSLDQDIHFNVWVLKCRRDSVASETTRGDDRLLGDRKGLCAW